MPFNIAVTLVHPTFWASPPLLCRWNPSVSHTSCRTPIPPRPQKGPPFVRSGRALPILDFRRDFSFFPPDPIRFHHFPCFRGRPCYVFRSAIFVPPFPERPFPLGLAFESFPVFFKGNFFFNLPLVGGPVPLFGPPFSPNLLKTPPKFVAPRMPYLYPLTSYLPLPASPISLKSRRKPF